MQLDNTFMHFLLEHQLRHDRSLKFVILMESLITAAHTLEYYYSAGALQNNLGSVGRTNIHGETVMRLDLMANQIVMRYLVESQEIVEATSEELSDEVRLHPNGRYFI